MTHHIEDLPFEYDALEPHISEQVMRWHHDIHHQGYADALGEAEAVLAENRKTGDHATTREALRKISHNACGHQLHQVLWKSMSPDGGGEPSGPLREQIEADFGSYEEWKSEFKAAAMSASGWALLVWHPVSEGLWTLAVDDHDHGTIWSGHPILGIDVWEHAYYYDYGPNREEYVDNFFEIIDWDEVSHSYETWKDIETEEPYG